MKKKLFLVALMVVVFALAIAGTAFATWRNSTYTTWSEASTATTGTDPHGGYQNTTRNCGVCHAVHNAALGGQILLATQVANACTYCHITTTVGYTVYGGNVAAYNTDAGNVGIRNHSQFVTPITVGGGTGCTACHAVHGANRAFSGVVGTDTFDLRHDITNNWAATYTSDPPTAGPLSAQNLSKWCSGCHPYYNTGHNGTSHIMNAATSNYSNGGATGFNGRVANSTSDNCQACHNGTSGLTPQGFSGFPHYTPNDPRFLGAGVVNAAGTAVNNDGVCLACHSGYVGVTF